MSWTARYAPELGVVEVILTDIVSPADLRAASRLGIDESVRHACPYHLCDASGVRGGHTISDLFLLVGALRDLGLSTVAHQALVPPATDRALQNAVFWETTCRNRGLDVRLFATRAAGLDWLAEIGARGSA